MNKDKYLQIFNYLLEFSKLRSNPVRDIESSDLYPEIVWFSDIPNCNIFDCVTFPQDNHDTADYWLKISKPKEPTEPKFPKLSETLTDWIEKDSLTDETKPPVLKESINKNGQIILLADLPEVATEFESYLNNKWNDDLKAYKEEFEIFQAKLIEFEIQSKTYKQFFSIYNKVHQFGEEFELVFGAGLLYFKENDDTPKICRHILTSKAEIIFTHSSRESSIQVLPSIENEILIETDAILDLDNQFDVANIISAEKEVAKFLKEQQVLNNLFASQIQVAIQLFADRIHPDGDSRSIEEQSKPQEIPKKPTVYLAPALLLRKRNTKSLTAIYEKIIENVNQADETLDIPSINDIISDARGEGTVQEPNPSLDDETIYFPKKYNDEQIEIIEKIRRSNKVLVQGPPGTGKSHTIANLICHLLANGKKVLVTAYTKRALEVLENQLPKDFQDLTVNLLSGDSAAIQGLNNSANAIDYKLANNTNLNRYKKDIEQQKLKLSEVKEAKAYTKNEWLKVKEKSTRKQYLNPNYEGTLLEIAERLEKQSPSFSWFNDECSNTESIELINGIEQFNLLTRNYRDIDSAIFNYVIPNKENLLLLSEFHEYLKIENELLQNSHLQENHTINCNDFPELKKQLKKLYDLFLIIENIPLIQSFKTSIINRYQTNVEPWKKKIERTKQLLEAVNQVGLRDFQRNVLIKYPEDKDLIALKNDATTLLNYLNKGYCLTGLKFAAKKPFLPMEIKQTLYFIDEVRVFDKPCCTIAGFEAVLTDIKIKQDLEELTSLWGVPANVNSISYIDKAEYYQRLNNSTLSFINAVGEAKQVISEIESISSASILNYESCTVKQLMEVVNYNHLLNQKAAYTEKLKGVNNHLSGQNIHPLANSIIASIETLDAVQYEQYLSEIDALNSEKEDYRKFKSLEATLQVHFPKLVNEILQGSFDISNLQHIKDAIYYKHAFAEITKLLEADYESTLINDLTIYEQQEEKLISEIGSNRAWFSVLERLKHNSSLQQHLQAWVLAISRIGTTGTGRRAVRFQREAQQQMMKCKDSLPCWIMPLYKVAETIKPEQGMYDYVIIDEASQLGPDAIFLLYISKNIIIVGDDKQTSPEYIGVKDGQMTPFIARYLQNIPFANFYGTDFSFFDHAKLFCNGLTVLREHFRCMPEIIEFCNKWFYERDGKGLYPLKQYSENRLEPLQHVYCQNGFVDGTGSNITNKVEAESIANKIAELIKEEKYTSKSFGVITLQGNKQAALIENLILKKIGEVEYHNRNILCGNSASFQGDERDVMFLSLVTAHNHNRSALTLPADERRFNVAVSRAKEQIWLFHSVQLADLSNVTDLRYKLLNHFLNHNEQQTPITTIFPRIFGNQPPPFESWFEVDVFNDIVAKHYGVIPQYELAKGRYRIDLVIMLPNGVKIAVECDGDKYHSAEEYENDLMRQRVLERCGWQLFRVRGSEYYSNRIKALAPLWELLRKNDVQRHESQNTNIQQMNDIEKIQIDTVEKKQSGNKKPSVPRIKNPSEQLDLFSKSLVGSKRRQPTPVNNRITTKHRATILSSFSDFLVFTSFKNVYKIKNKGFTSKTQIIHKIEFEPGEKSIYLTGTNNYTGFLLLGFENGKVAKISFSSYQTEQNRRRLINAFNAESKLIFIEHVENDIDLVAVSKVGNNSKIVLFNTELIQPKDSRTSVGVQVMRLREGSVMTALKKLDDVTKLDDPEYYRKPLNVVGYYLKQGNEI